MFFSKRNGYALYIKAEINGVNYYVLGVSDANSLDDYLSEHNLNNSKIEVLAFSHSENAYPLVKKLLKYFNKNDIRLINVKKIPSCLLGLEGVYSKDVLGIDYELYKEERKIISKHAEDGLGGCLFITLILIGLIGIPLGGWGIPILIIAGLWWFSAIGKEIDNEIEHKGVFSRPKHPEKFQKIIDSLFLDIDKYLK